LDAVFAKASSMATDKLLEANATAFSSWLTAEDGHLLPLLDSVLDFGAFDATLGVTHSFQANGCDHLKKLGLVKHNFPSVDDLRGLPRIELARTFVRAS